MSLLLRKAPFFLGPCYAPALALAMVLVIKAVAVYVVRILIAATSFLTARFHTNY
jgi:hypothetical protein